VSAPPELPGIFHALQPVLENYGYLAVGGLVFLEDFGVPVPGETVLIAAAIYAGAGRLNVAAVGALAFVAAVVGDNIGYVIGRFGGRELVVRWGRYVFLTPERLALAEDFFGRHGGKVVTVARFIEVLRQANGIIAGTSRMPWKRRFLPFQMLGAALWVGLWTSVGYLAGSNINKLYNQLTRYELYFAIVAAALFAAYVAHRALAHRRRKRKAAAAGGRSGEGREAESSLPRHG
jgi:membrane protein DedA with SNARE-associated domain